MLTTTNVPSARPLLVVGAALIDGQGRVLIQRRPDGKQHGGLWEFPGGKVEPGETPEAALVRELAEELTITVAAERLVPAGFATARGIVLLLYSILEWSGDAVATDGARLEWAIPSAIDPTTMPPADRPLVDVVRALVQRR